MTIQEPEGKSLAFRLTGGELLLLHQTLAGAFAVRRPNFATQVGLTKTRARAVLDQFEALMHGRQRDADELPIGPFDLSFSEADTRALRNALELVMTDFGHAEFSTRTGFDLAQGAQMLDKLNAALIAPLHIEHRARAVPQEQVAQSS